MEPPSSSASASSDAAGIVRSVRMRFIPGSRLRAALRLNQSDVHSLVRGSQAVVDGEVRA